MFGVNGLGAPQFECSSANVFVTRSWVNAFIVAATYNGDKLERDVSSGPAKRYNADMSDPK